MSEKTLMVVDDEKDILNVIKRGLEQEHFGVHDFSDPQAALQHIKNDCKTCELLISDIRMPNMNGIQLAKRIRELRPNMRVILMTAFEINKEELESISPSTPVLLNKPFSRSQLAATIKNL